MTDRTVRLSDPGPARRTRRVRSRTTDRRDAAIFRRRRLTAAVVLIGVAATVVWLIVRATGTPPPPATTPWPDDTPLVVVEPVDPDDPQTDPCAETSAPRREAHQKFHHGDDAAECFSG